MAKIEKTNDPIADAINAVTAGNIASIPKPHKEAGDIASSAKAEMSAYEVSQRAKELGYHEKVPNTAQVGSIAAPTRKRTLSITRMRTAGYLHNTWDVTVEHGTTVDDVKSPDFWRHVAAQFKLLDQITVVCEDGSWEASLRVLLCDALWAKVGVRSYHDWTKVNTDVPRRQEEDYDISWNVIGNFTITKKGLEGQPPVKDGFHTKLEAYQWLDGHLKTLNA